MSWQKAVRKMLIVTRKKSGTVDGRSESSVYEGIDVV